VQFKGFLQEQSSEKFATLHPTGKLAGRPKDDHPAVWRLHGVWVPGEKSICFPFFSFLVKLLV
jgi:hypothetical protein